MNDIAITYRPIGFTHSAHRVLEKTLIQPACGQGCRGWVEVFPDFAEGLRDLEGFSHIFLFYHFHHAPPVKLIVEPFLQDIERGLFVTRAPCRPNPIGLSVVQLIRREDNVLHCDGLDVLDGTPIAGHQTVYGEIRPYRNPTQRLEGCDRRHKRPSTRLTASFISLTTPARSFLTGC